MNVKINKNIYIFFLSFLFVFVLYHLTKQVSIAFSNLVVPTGDPFSYEWNLIILNNESSASIKGYISKLAHTIMSSQWYYAYKLPIALIAPLISNEHSTFILINYFYLLLALICIQTSLRVVSGNYIINFFSGITVCFLPWMWGYQSPISLQQIALDTQVYLVGVSYFALLLKCFFNIKNDKNLIFTAIVGGLFTWTRGNAFSYFLFLTIPILTIFYLRFYYLNKEKKKIIIKKIYKPILIFLFIFLWFAFFTSQGIIHYYSVQSSVIDYKLLKSEQIFHSLKIIFLNYPGCFFSSDSFINISYKNIFFSIVYYLLLFLPFLFFYKKKKINKINLKYYYIFLISIITVIFLKFLELYNVPFISNGFSTAHTQIVPLIPFTLIYIFLINFILNFYKKKILKINFFIFLFLFGLFFFSTLHSFINTKIANVKKIYTNRNYPNFNKNYYKRIVNAKELEKFSVNLDNEISNPIIYTLIYNFYNPVILNYYREKNNLKRIKNNGELQSDIIAPFISNPNFRGGKEKFKLSLRKILNEADYIIIPKLINDYKYLPNILANKFYNEMHSIINDKKNPKFQVVMELNDWIDLVLIKKVNQEENLNIYDGNRKDYENIKSDINIMENKSTTIWDNLIKINSYQELISYKNMKLLFSGNTFPVSNLFDKNFDNFWQSKKNTDEIIVKFEKKISLNQITLFAEDRYGKENKNYHKDSFKSFPTEFEIFASNNLENWKILSKISNISLIKNQYIKNFMNNQKYHYYLIKLKNNYNYLRVYEIKFNNDYNPDSYISVK